MPNRVANFKVQSSKDVEQDTEIDTLTTTLNNLVIPPSEPWYTITATSDVNMGLHAITNSSTVFTNALKIGAFRLSPSGSRLGCFSGFIAYGDLTGSNVGTEGNIYNNGTNDYK